MKNTVGGRFNSTNALHLHKIHDTGYRKKDYRQQKTGYKKQITENKKQETELWIMKDQNGRIDTG